MTKEQAQHDHDADSEDQYSRPVCGSSIDANIGHLGPNTRKVLDVLRALEGNDAGV